ncbi:MAG: hypothetical protein IPP47_07640 [Bryobacterales bacterium]|nr:hypothetical protein [Bryobacterales bacterium]
MPGARAWRRDAKSGKRLWTALEDKGAYTAPMVATLNGQRQIVDVTGERALDRRDGGGRCGRIRGRRTTRSTARSADCGRNHDSDRRYGHGAAMIEITAEGGREMWESKAMKC